ncbi:MAG: glycoside hydrolase family 92 protein [Victivallales bacterium]|nr:glycoside hydrolase family 92 protein [Victivallales bacterium]
MMFDTQRDAYALVDPFWGNGAVRSRKPEGTVRGWNWLKAQTGNTHPGAQLPFGWVSACPYSGAYPTGYGKNGCSGNGPAPQVYDRKVAWGITHFQMSGTGYVGHFYNYLLCTPSFSGARTGHVSDLIDEIAKPGYYSATLADYGVDFELTAAPFAAMHRYHFHGGRGHLDIDINAIGLRLTMGKRYGEQIDWNAAARHGETGWQGSLIANGVQIWFCILVKGEVAKSALYNCVIEYDFATADVEMAIGCSMGSAQNAELHAKEAAAKGFDSVHHEAQETWSTQLERIRVEFSDPALAARFYSCLYHSLVKPVRHDGGYIDFVTMWDIYRTQLPLALSVAPSHARALLLSMLDTIERFGFFPIFYSMNETLDRESNQASALVVYTLCDGFVRGILTPDDYPRVKRALIAEFRHADYTGKSPTHILDIAGAYHAASLVAQTCGDSEYAEELQEHSVLWEKAYDPATGYLVQDAIYYEGNYRNYSFRAHTGMLQRIALAGGSERFNQMLDDFFTIGYDGPETAEVRPTREGYFEALNNESDMETPATYLWCGRADRFAEVSDLIRRFQFTDGEGGAPGNVDSGALSSWYVWSCLGLYPLTGTQYYLLGSPSVAKAEIDLTQGTLRIETVRESPTAIYPVEYIFNGRSFREPWLPVAELEHGGTLVFHLADQPPATPTPIPTWL